MALIRYILFLYAALVVAKAPRIDVPNPAAVAATWMPSDESATQKLKAAPLTPPTPLVKLLLADKPWLIAPDAPVTFINLDTKSPTLKPTPHAYGYRFSGLSPPTPSLS